MTHFQMSRKIADTLVPTLDQHFLDDEPIPGQETFSYQKIVLAVNSVYTSEPIIVLLSYESSVLYNQTVTAFTPRIMNFSLPKLVMCSDLHKSTFSLSAPRFTVFFFRLD